MISLKGKTILVVDDEPGYREVLADEFKMADATVLQAESGNKAFEIVKNNKIDAIITDIRMAGGNGIELLDKIKVLSPEVPVVMLITGFSDLDPQDAYDKGAEAIFSKPCDLDALVESVYRALLERKERWVRTLIRRTDDFVVELEVESPSQAVTVRAFNIGRGGMYIAFDGNLPDVGKRVSFLVKTKSHKFEGIGVCRWIRAGSESRRPRGFGIEFQDLTEDALNALLEVLKTLSQTPYIPKE